MAKVSIRNLGKVYPNAKNAPPAVDGFSLDIDDGEFIVFVGPSGCGKSTTLRMIAGLENITSGELYIDGALMNNISPKDRNIAMVFQNYALYPNLNLFENMAFSLRIRKVLQYIIETTVTKTARKLEIDNLLDRLPRHISGGQRQRVALGRAIVREPKVFLMDEPLSNLDAKMRVQMRIEIIKLQRQLGVTAIYVTHDQIEALTMSDRIVVMDKGVVQQIGTPKEIYNNPVNIFVGGFIGSPPMNFMEGSITQRGEGLWFYNKQMSIKITSSQEAAVMDKNYKDTAIILGIRPEQLSIIPMDEDAPDSFVGKVDVVEMVGSDSFAYIDVNTWKPIVVRIPVELEYEPQTSVRVRVNMNRAIIFDKNTSQRVI